MQKAKSEIVLFVRNSLGIDLSVYDETFLLKSLQKRMTATACDTMADYYLFLRANQAETGTFVQSLNITYSEFFRDPLVFALLQQTILPDILRNKKKNGRKEIRIWSAACASGQEAYSLAILLDQLEAGKQYGVHCHIFATDISATEIEIAKTGVYAPSSLQNVPMKYMDQYFSREGDYYKIAAQLREAVDFSVYDLLDQETKSLPSSIIGDFDLVFCSNLLFYFKQNTQKLIMNKTIRNLAPGGFVVTGEVEKEILSSFHFSPVFTPATIFKNNNDTASHNP